MAAPNPFQKLKHGVLLCKANFMTFVETFNFLVDFAQNLRGDGENGRDGVITVDRTVPDQPVIRSRINASTIDYLLDKKNDNGRFCIKGTESSSSSAEMLTIGNCYYRIGSRTYQMNDATVTVAQGQFLALKVNISGQTPQPTLKTYSSLSAMKADEDDERYYISPLYKFKSEGGVECDFRIGPDAAAWEFAQ